MHDDPLREILATARVAEAVGLDAVFVPETPRLFPDPLVALAALAMATTRVGLGSLVIVAPFRHPALLARTVADVDRLSGGRLVLGLGIGKTERQFRTIDAPWGSVAARRAALGETIEIMTGLWSGESLTYHGRHYRTEDMRVFPGPRQSPRPPLLIAGSGDGTLEQVARSADACNLFGGPAQVRARLARLDECCDAAGRPRAEVLRSYYDFPVLAATAAEAEAKLRRVMTDDVVAARGAQGLLVVGTPDQAVTHYRALIQAGIQYFTVNLADTADHETLQLLATAVIPRLAA
jgi:alkanesulfonate monooxygenase SsuD/methylene tetrahydromethanopterin reductase-like flavin-dependent oxidoreductase (luciferase family)